MIEHNTGSAPVIWVRVKKRDGRMHVMKLDAVDWSFSNEEPETDIIEYELLYGSYIATKEFFGWLVRSLMNLKKKKST